MKSKNKTQVRIFTFKKNPTHPTQQNPPCPTPRGGHSKLKKKKKAPVRVESLIVMLTKPHRIDGNDFRSQKGRENSRLRGSFGRLGGRLHFCGETPTFVVKVGEGKYSCCLGGNKRDGGMLLNFGIGNIRMVSFLRLYTVYMPGSSFCV